MDYYQKYLKYKNKYIIAKEYYDNKNNFKLEEINENSPQYGGMKGLAGMKGLTGKVMAKPLAMLPPAVVGNVVPKSLGGGIQAGKTQARAMIAGVTPAGATPAGTMPAGATPAGTTQARATPAGATPAGTTQARATSAGATQTGATQAGVQVKTPAGTQAKMPVGTKQVDVAQQLLEKALSDKKKVEDTISKLTDVLKSQKKVNVQSSSPTSPPDSPRVDLPSKNQTVSSSLLAPARSAIITGKPIEISTERPKEISAGLNDRMKKAALKIAETMKGKKPYKQDIMDMDNLSNTPSNNEAYGYEF